jgi:hypothetical protein
MPKWYSNMAHEFLSVSLPFPQSLPSSHATADQMNHSTYFTLPGYSLIFVLS